MPIIRYLITDEFQYTETEDEDEDGGIVLSKTKCDTDKKTVFVALQNCTLNILWGILEQYAIMYDFSGFLTLFRATEIQVNSQTLFSSCDLLPLC